MTIPALPVPMFEAGLIVELLLVNTAVEAVTPSQTIRPSATNVVVLIGMVIDVIVVPAPPVVKVKVPVTDT